MAAPVRSLRSRRASSRIFGWSPLARLRAPCGGAARLALAGRLEPARGRLGIVPGNVEIAQRGGAFDRLPLGIEIVAAAIGAGAEAGEFDDAVHVAQQARGRG